MYIGHEMETLNYKDKFKLVGAFFKGQTGPSWLAGTHVRWIFYGPYERALAEMGILPLDGLETAYETENVIIYRVMR